MARIFISYRRDDTAGYSHLLADRLSRYFGRNSVFMDVDTIDPGVDFVSALERAVGSCDTLLALIGKRWLNIRDEYGRRRIDVPEDYVRLEIATALAHDIRVIPVLVRGATMPSSPDLPDVIRPLARRNAIALSDERIDYDLKRLINALVRSTGMQSWLDRFEVQGKEEVLAGGAKPASPQQRATPLPTRLLFEPELVRVPAGAFLAGPRKDAVSLPEFWIGKFPVKVIEYRAFIDSGGYSTREFWTEKGWAWRESQDRTQPDLWGEVRWTGNDWQPVIGVTWYEAHAYTRWLAAKTRWPYRLPSSLEWEKAARSDDGRIYPWGDVPRSGVANIYGLGVPCTTQVGQYSPLGDSPYGVCDLVGNVSEWCATRWTSAVLPDEDDPEGDAPRVRHGGSWSSVNLVKPSQRIRGAPDFCSNYVGFRVARGAFA